MAHVRRGFVEGVLLAVSRVCGMVVDQVRRPAAAAPRLTSQPPAGDVVCCSRVCYVCVQGIAFGASRFLGDAVRGTRSRTLRQIGVFPRGRVRRPEPGAPVELGPAGGPCKVLKPGEGDADGEGDAGDGKGGAGAADGSVVDVAKAQLSPEEEAAAEAERFAAIERGELNFDGTDGTLLQWPGSHDAACSPHRPLPLRCSIARAELGAHRGGR